MPSNRPAFTLLEVLISVMLLFVMGMALIRFDTWIHFDIGRYKEQATLLYRYAPLFYFSDRPMEAREISLYDATAFRKLRDDESFYLKQESATVSMGKEAVKTLFQNDEIDLTYRYFPMRLEKAGTSIRMIRIRP